MFEPRLESSQRHTPQNVPKDLLKMVKESLLEKYADFLINKTLCVEGVIYPEEFIILVGVKNKDSIRQFNFECSMSYNSGDITDESPLASRDDVLAKINFAFEALDSVFMEYIEEQKALGDLEDTSENEVQWPLSWTAYPFEKETIYLKTTATNTDIERLTIEFLKENSPEKIGSMDDFDQLN